MPDVELARREGVELVKTGSWATMTGTWNPTPADLAAAVEAQSCPAIRRPIVKLGHVDSRFDGEPALGWFENLRIGDGGTTLLGDQVTLPWLHSVQAAAYPSRSVEGNYNHTCSEGHRHKFVLTAVALLGVTPPAVRTIRNLNDLPAMLGVAASQEVPDGAEHVQVTVLAGRHSFDEHKHHRDGDGKFSHTDSHDGTGLPGSKSTGLKRDEKAAGRIPLGDGETYMGSGTVAGANGAGIAVAAVDSPDGPKLRIGVGIDNNDLGSWSGANRGATAVLDSDGMQQLATAIPQLLDAGKDGKAVLKEFEKRDAALQKRERDLVDRQYPELTASGRKELAKIDSRSAEVGNDLTHLAEKQQNRADLMPDPADRKRFMDLDAQAAKAAGAGDAEKLAEVRSQQRAALDKGLAGTGYEKVAPTLFSRDAARADALRAESNALAARRAELTAVQKPLSDADQAGLNQVRADIARNDQLWGDFNDSSVLAEGSIPGEWGNVEVRAEMAADTPQYTIRVVPADGSEPQAGEPFEASDLRKLAGLLEKAGVGAAVKAAAASGEPVHTGAMVALIPTAEDAERLAVDGGEPVEELHLTLAYLGEAANLGAQGQQDVIDAVSAAVNGMPVIDADVFSAAVYNPGDATDREPCLVYQVSGDMLDALHTMVTEVLIGAPIPEQHAPWFSHITATYSGDLSRLAGLAEQVGPVTFDRVRLAFGDRVVDIPLIDDEPPGDAPVLEVPNMLMPVAAASADTLREYWVHGPGAKAIRWGTKNDFYRCVRQLKRHVADPKGLCNVYYREALGVAPGQEDVHASADTSEQTQPPTVIDRMDAIGLLEPDPDLPAAEPEQVIIPDPKEGLVSTDLSGIRSRLGLDDTADEQAILTALDELKTKADTPAVAEPTPEMVAASAAAVEKAEQAEAEKDELRKEVTVLASQVKTMSDELAASKAEKFATVKASVIDAAVTAGKIKPADKAQWETDYDEAPGAITRVLASIAPGTAVPVAASGSIGDPEPAVDDSFDADYERAFGTKAGA